MKQPANTKLLFKIERTRIVLDKEDSDGLDPDALLVAMEDVGTDNNANSKPTLSALLDLSEDIESVNLARMNSIQAKHNRSSFTRTRNKNGYVQVGKYDRLIERLLWKKLIFFSFILNDKQINTTNISLENCYIKKDLIKRNTRLGKTNY